MGLNCIIKKTKITTTEVDGHVVLNTNNLSRI